MRSSERVCEKKNVSKLLKMCVYLKYSLMLKEEGVYFRVKAPVNSSEQLNSEQFFVQTDEVRVVATFCSWSKVGQITRAYMHSILTFF